jgi:D-alanyl-D-alanine carboxypeptidase/D-alanyl-D-alanine-endopeptidase (penicillin-binding protein 4)
MHLPFPVRLSRLVAPALVAFACAAFVRPASAAQAPATSGRGTSAPALGPDAAVLATPEELLQLELDGLLRGSVGERATAGAEVRSLTRDEVLYSLNAERLLQPASNIKLFTAAAALHYLGPYFSFATSLYATGPVEPGGVLRGDLVLEGRGDPNLSGRFYADSVTYAFDRLAESLLGRGIQRVAGDLVGDNSYFEGPKLGEGWAWDVQQWWYAAQIDALSFNDNTVTIVATPGPAPGAPAEIRKIPDTAYLTVESAVVTTPGRSGQAVALERRPGTNLVTLTGRVPLRGGGATVIVTVEDPGRFALTVFRERLARAGITVDGQTRLVRGEEDLAQKPEWTPLARHYSPPLGEILKVVNKRSQNFYAEQLLKTIGAEVRGRGSANAGIGAVDDFLRGEVGLEPGAIHMVDGSGLSLLNLVTPRAIVRLLAHMARHPYAREFYESLQVPGEDERSRRLDEPLTRGNVHAKTGTVRHVSAYSGYVTAANGERLAFSILVNNRPRGKSSSVQLENEVVRALARFTR